jgi:hypothetical protein
MNPSRQAPWIDVQRRCRLSDEAVAMAKELGLSPRSLVENIPSPGERWTAPVEDWIRGLHAHRFGQRPPSDPAAPGEPATPPPAAATDSSAPEPPPEAVNELKAVEEALLAKASRGEVDAEVLADEMERLERETPVSGGEINEENRLLRRRRDGFRRFADLFARGAARLDFVQRIVLFGSVVAPLQKEIPRFARLRRARIAVWHECKDVDLAVWVTDLTRLREFKRAVADATNHWQTLANQEHLPGIPHHQADIFLLEAGTDRYRGNLCIYGQCPKGKPECEVAGCGAQPFLQLYEDFRFDRRAPYGEHGVVLFDRFSPPAKT